MRARQRAFAAIMLAAAGFGFDYDIVAAGIIRQIALIDTQKQHSIALRHKFSTRTDKNEVVIIVADYGDERAGGLIAHQFVAIRNGVQSARS